MVAYSLSRTNKRTYCDDGVCTGAPPSAKNSSMSVSISNRHGSVITILFLRPTINTSGSIFDDMSGTEGLRCLRMA